MSLVVVTATGPTTSTLPLISSVPGLTITIKDNGSASLINTITIQPTVGNTFESGVASYILNTPLAYITFIGNPTTLKWRVLATSYADVPITTPVAPPATGTLGGVTGTLANLSVSGLTTLGNSSNTGNLGVAGTTTLNSVSATNINFTGLLSSNGTTFSGAPAGINSSGNVGIGAAAGSTTLLVTGTQSNTGTLGVAGATTLAGTLGVTGLTTLVNSSNTGTLGVAGNITTTGSIITSGLSFSNGNSGATYNFATINSGIGYNRMTLTAATNGLGNYYLGINCNAPAEFLDVNGNAKVSGSLGVTGNANVTGNTVVTGTLTATNGFYGRLGINQWIYSTENRARFYFAGDANTLMQSGSGYEFRNRNDTSVFNINSSGSITASGGIEALGNSGSISVPGSGGGQTITNCITGGGVTLGRFFADNSPFIYGNPRLTLHSSNGTVGIFNNNLSVGGSITSDFISVVNSKGLTYGAGAFFTTGSGGQTLATTGASAAGLSITANNFIFSAEGFIAASDERIKKNIKPVTDSLDIVNKLNLVSFDYIDIIKHKSAKHGLIAQQVKEVYPEAVIKTKDFIPSVFSVATSYEKKDDNVTITSAVTGFSVNDKIRLYISDDTTYENEEKYETEVLEIISDTQFVVKAWDKFTTGKNIFIYGKEIDDFLEIDKPLIGLLATGACQTLSGQVSTLQSESSHASTITGQQASTITGLEATIAAILEKYPL